MCSSGFSDPYSARPTAAALVESLNVEPSFCRNEQDIFQVLLVSVLGIDRPQAKEHFARECCPGFRA